MEDLHFFVMQFIEGQSLEHVLRAHRILPLELVRPIVYQMGTALAYAHRRGVIHRDVKPGNVLLSGEGDALVTDFGIAKVAAGPTQTATGMVVGTPSYMSPEQCHAQELDGKSDQYSLGIVAYQMLTGTVPFAGSTFAIMHGHTSQPVPPIRDLVPSVPASVEQAIVRMLAKEASDRFATLAEVLQALEARPVGEDACECWPPPPHRQPAEQRRPRHGGLRPAHQQLVNPRRRRAQRNAARREQGGAPERHAAHGAVRAHHRAHQHSGDEGSRGQRFDRRQVHHQGRCDVCGERTRADQAGWAAAAHRVHGGSRVRCLSTVADVTGIGRPNACVRRCSDPFA